MKKPNHREEAPLLQWSSPIDASLYDRHNFLNTEEQAIVGQLTIKWKKPRGYTDDHFLSSVKFQDPLYTLLKPIHDLWALTGDRKKQELRSAIRLLITEMHQKQKTYWAWTDQDWIDLVKSSPTTFYQDLHVGRCREFLFIIAYVLCDNRKLLLKRQYKLFNLAKLTFGETVVEQVVVFLSAELIRWGYSDKNIESRLKPTVCLLLLCNRSPNLRDLSVEVLHYIRDECLLQRLKGMTYTISIVLAQMGYIKESMEVKNNNARRQAFQDKLEGLPKQWIYWCQRWRDTSTLIKKTRQAYFQLLMRIGRWAVVNHPEITSPKDWDRNTALNLVTAIDNLKVGDWLNPDFNRELKNTGKPLMATAKVHWLNAIRAFFKDGQEWEWFPRRFDPNRWLATPRSIRSQIGPDPRVIADEFWFKIMYAGLNLTQEDLNTLFPSRAIDGRSPKYVFYPLEMVKAIVMVWLFGGLRCNEILRLRVGCIRWHGEDAKAPMTGKVQPKEAVCQLHVPVNKTSTAFTKYVDSIMGTAIAAWERVRSPQQPLFVDKKTGEAIHLLFFYRGKPIGRDYINQILIPMLCRKVGIPNEDNRGTITSHRARATIISQLYNSPNPLSSDDLRKWAGHSLLTSIQYYTKTSPENQAKAFEKAGYAKHSFRMIKVLIDQDAIKNGAVAQGEPWMFYDLGHGYCTFDLFDQCAHRMACAKCTHYRPKGTTYAQLLEGKANLMRMLQEIPLIEQERLAVEDGIAAFEKLCQKLADVPTPDGSTPRQLGQKQDKTST